LFSLDGWSQEQIREAEMKWRKAEKNFVDSARVARLATVDAKGIPYNVPICPLLHSGKLYFGTAAGAKKVRNIKASAGVALVFDDYTEAWEHLRGIMVQGRARVVSARNFRGLRKKLYTKYLRYESTAPLDEGEAVIVEVIPQRKFSWEL
jgi:nitroimidazol reductase NimA-like FMN-containing flavoprotein (pyridoxamine 5'-phosphate oxidase superfamily)